MSSPRIRLQFDRDVRQYQPGEHLAGRFFLEDPQPPDLRAAELSVLWYTAGKGEEDLGVHYFERFSAEGGQRLDLRVPHRFHLALPASPLSYDGILVKLCWCARLRLFFSRGQESVAEAVFRLGSVKPAVPIKGTPARP
jgi:hypothetical protein